MGSILPIDTVTATTYNDSVLNTSYWYYKISALNQVGESVLSLYKSGYALPPSAPAMVSATSGTLATVGIIWRLSSGANSYKLYRSASSSFLSPIFIFEGSDTTYSDTVSSDSIYYYKTKALSLAGESSLSTNSVSGYRIPSVSPLSPQSPTASTNRTSNIYLTWTRPSGAVPVNGYILYRSETESGIYQPVDSTLSTYYYDYVSKTFPDSYWYYITAWNGHGESVPSDTTFGIRQ